MSDRTPVSVSHIDSIFLSTFSFSAEPGLTLPIVDRWAADDRVYLRLQHPGNASCEKFQVVQAFTAPGGRYLLLHTHRVPSLGATFVVQVLPDTNHVLSLTPEDFSQLRAQISSNLVLEDFGSLSEYIGEFQDLTQQIASREKRLGEALTGTICLQFEPVSPDSRLTISGKWQHYDSLFLELRHTPADAGQVFRLDWILELDAIPYAVLAYPNEITAESDVVPAIVLRIQDERTLVVLTEIELAEIRLLLIDRVAVRDKTGALEAAKYLGSIETRSGGAR